MAFVERVIWRIFRTCQRNGLRRCRCSRAVGLKRRGDFRLYVIANVLNQESRPSKEFFKLLLISTGLDNTSLSFSRWPCPCNLPACALALLFQVDCHFMRCYEICSQSACVAYNYVCFCILKDLLCSQICIRLDSHCGSSNKNHYTAEKA
ncbi:hypothetical protein F5050DRAFT_560228 [Lentinula boryana]|uniref:Uncharacterized protein n=1 Tax=Lentinula boryana TaxID=40481 RepID=A0ABQ8Q6Q1_9AGAR|nr:hypothetical protein F5050DRAFT_560228 [Lentinula boryana]